MIKAHGIGHCDSAPADTITLSFDDRYRRRLAMLADNGLAFLLELESTTQLREGDDLLLDDGRHVRVKAALEALMSAECDDLQRLMRTAWHVGNRHLPCEIHDNHIVLRSDHVIQDMLEKLGCRVAILRAPFNPEGGAYGQGRTHAH